MSTLLHPRDVLDRRPGPPETDVHDRGDGGGTGFVDCRGVLHTWDEEDD